MRILFSALMLVAALPFATRAANNAATDTKAPAKNLLLPTNDPDSWVFELNDEGKGEMAVDGEAIVFRTPKTTGTDWHVQAYQPHLDLQDDQTYIVRFQMKAAQPVHLLLVAQINEEDWHEIGLHEDLDPTDELKDYEFEFTAHNTVDKNNRLGFVLGIDEGTVTVKEMTLTAKKLTEKK